MCGRRPPPGPTEADNDPEPLAVIHTQALAYRRLAEDPAWRAAWERQYGPLPAPRCPPARVTADGVNLRAGPGLQAAVLRKLRRDEALSVLDCGGLEQDGFTWWEVAGADGTRGWAATRWLESPPADPP